MPPFRVEEAPPTMILVTKQVRGSDGRPRADTFLGVEVERGTFECLSGR